LIVNLSLYYILQVAKKFRMALRQVTDKLQKLHLPDRKSRSSLLASFLRNLSDFSLEVICAVWILCV